MGFQRLRTVICLIRKRKASHGSPTVENSSSRTGKTSAQAPSPGGSAKGEASPPSGATTGSALQRGLPAPDRGGANKGGGSVEAMGRDRAGTLCLVVSRAFPRPLPFTRVGSRDHETVVGSVVVSRLRTND